jgi:histidinol-phosphate aminotransferase
MYLSRRAFTEALGAGLSAALVAPRLEAAPLADETSVHPDTASLRKPIVLNSNENPYGPSASALEAMTRSQALAGRYPDAAETEVLAALARLHSVAPEQIVLGCGSGEILRMADMAFLSAGRTVVVAEPTFEAVLGYAGVTKAEAVKVPLTADFRHDLPKLAAACDARTGLVYVCNPNNPTATIVGADEIGAFLARVPPTATILIDEAYHHFVEDKSYRTSLEWLERYPNVIVVRTFSKIYGLAGMRLGYAVASRENAEALRAQGIWSNGNAAVLAAAVASLADGAAMEERRRVMNDTRRWLCDELRKDGRRYMPSQANFVMIHLGRDVAPLIEAFKARGMLVGRKFPSLPEWLRISIGTRGETAAFLEGLRALVA